MHRLSFALISIVSVVAHTQIATAADMTSALSILIFGGLLTIVAIDHPFAGTVKVGPDALVSVINDFADWTPR